MCAQRYIDWHIESGHIQDPLGYRVELGGDRTLPSVTSRNNSFDNPTNFYYAESGKEEDLVPYPRLGINDPVVGTLVRFDLRGLSPQQSLAYVNSTQIRKMAVDANEVLGTSETLFLEPLSVAVDRMTNETWVLDSNMVVTILDGNMVFSRTTQVPEGTFVVVPDLARKSYWMVSRTSVDLADEDGSILASFVVPEVSGVLAWYLSRHSGDFYLSASTIDLVSSSSMGSEEFHSSSNIFCHFERGGYAKTLSLLVTGMSEWDEGQMLLAHSAPSVTLYSKGIPLDLGFIDLTGYGITVDRLSSKSGDIYVLDRSAGMVWKIAASTQTPMWSRKADGTSDYDGLDIGAGFDVSSVVDSAVSYWSSDVVGAIRDYGASAVESGLIQMEDGVYSMGAMLSGYPASPVWAKITPVSKVDIESSSSSSLSSVNSSLSSVSSPSSPSSSSPFNPVLRVATTEVPGPVSPASVIDVYEINGTFNGENAYANSDESWWIWYNPSLLKFVITPIKGIYLNRFEAYGAPGLIGYYFGSGTFTGTVQVMSYT